MRHLNWSIAAKLARAATDVLEVRLGVKSVSQIQKARRDLTGAGPNICQKSPRRVAPSKLTRVVLRRSGSFLSGTRMELSYLPTGARGASTPIKIFTLPGQLSSQEEDGLLVRARATECGSTTAAFWVRPTSVSTFCTEANIASR